MNLGESLRISWRAITGHKLRSSLTTIGVVIGVASIIALMVLGGAFQQSVIGDVGGEDEPVLLVQTQTPVENGAGFQTAQVPIYTESDVQAIRDLEGVEYVGLGGTVDDAVQLTHGGEDTLSFSAQIATTESLERGGNFSAGGPFESEDEVVVNGRLERLLGHEVAVGDELRVRFGENDTRTFTVTGVVRSPNPQVGPVVYFPADPYYDRTVETPDGDEEVAYTSLTVYTGSVDDLDAVQDRVQEYFATEEADAPRLKSGVQEIRVQTVSDLLDEIQGILDQITLLVAGIAGIALVVGSIGIANIMIVSVTERTREIGIMKAVGARRRDVIQLFLVEAVILGTIGAIGGVALGLGAGYGLTSLLSFPMYYPWYWVGVAVAVGVGVGVVSGLYPAWSAARVDPIEALRRE